MAHGQADDLATTALLATDKPVLIAPAMNHRMWHHAATQDNLKTLAARGIRRVGPDEGDMACGEFGMGRMAEPEAIFAAIRSFFDGAGRLAGRHALVTSGPTHEPIDPVRYIANRSSGRQGHAIAEALAAMGARTTLVTGPVSLADPAGVAVHHVETAAEMLKACEAALPADVAVCAAAVADWRPATAADRKIKKNGTLPALEFAENPDILKTLSQADNRRPALVIGFAAETGDTVELARAKRSAKGCDWIVANDVSPESGVFGGDQNTVHVIDGSGVEDWPKMAKAEVAERLALRIAGHFEAVA
jgi:phosphopantothenoylcysteine decarboxylase/phosphopantothenate--cysteine ligase